MAARSGKEAFSRANFLKWMETAFVADLKAEQALALAVSGGPDSMAMLDAAAHALADMKRLNAPHVPALRVCTVDHGLRPEAAQEAEMVAAYCKVLAKDVFKDIKHATLRREGEKPSSRLQERAREARYDLLGAYCKAQGARFLFLGHHRDDQAETFLYRLAKGSGLDGLAGMQAFQPMKAGGTDLMLVRPFLEYSKSEMAAYCAAHAVPFISDPSNRNEAFARVRLRAAREALEKEGLSAKRLALTAERLRRARQAIEIMSETSFNAALYEKNTKQIVLNLEAMRDWPEEVVLRGVLQAIDLLGAGGVYGPRLERVEDLASDLHASLSRKDDKNFRTRTLAGLIFSLDRGAGVFRIIRERHKKTAEN